MNGKKQQRSKNNLKRPRFQWEAFIQKHQVRIIGSFCLLAALRIFFFSSLFPPINSIDEQSHLDLIIKYSKGHIPCQISQFDDDARLLLWICSSAEYMGQAKDCPGGVWPVPEWMSGRAKDPTILKTVKESYLLTPRKYFNHEDTQFPVYYLLGAGWYKIGCVLGLEGGFLFYWLRWFNILILISTVLLAYAFAKRFFPDSLYLQVAAPGLIAVLPQDVFYGLNNDVPSALFFGGALYCLLDIYLTKDRKKYLYHFLAGLLVAATFLIKVSNFTIVPVLGLIVFLHLRKAKQEKTFKPEISRIGVLVTMAIVPICFWLIRNLMLVGDWSGSTEKIKCLGWVAKPFTAMWDHPIFSLDGFFSEFWSKLITSFWRGEIFWHGEIMTQGWFEMVYLLSSTILLIVVVIALASRRLTKSPQERFVLALGAGIFILNILLLVWISIRYDFGACYYPSRAEPFLVSGRLLLSALIPFVFLYLYGLQFILRGKTAQKLRYGILILFFSAMIVVEILSSQAVFQSRFNWFSMINSINTVDVSLNGHS